MHPLESLNHNPFVLAPMAGITDHAFRSFMRKMGAGVVVTELISATGIEFKSERTLNLMSYDESQRPVGIQLFGEDPKILAKSAQVAETQGADFVDLNFGCPVPKVVKKGAGSAMLKDLPVLTTVLKTVKEAIKIPLTIKIRTGWDAHSRNALEVCKIAENEGITWVAIHGRTRAQGYSGLADWDFIADIKAKTRIPILGNGDLNSPTKAVQRLRETGCDGVLIGRGCLKNPFIFQDAVDLWRGDLQSKTNRALLPVLLDLKEFLEKHAQPHLVGLQMKKFAAWYSSGYPGASQFRKKIFQSKTDEEIMAAIHEFFVGMTLSAQEDTSGEDFLMGGHG